MNMSIMKRTPASVFGLLCPLAVQNGGADNKDFMEDGAPSAASNMGSGAKPFSLKTENDLDDCLDEVDNSSRVPRPQRKGLGFDSGFHSSDDDGSLPTSPDSQLSMPEFPTEETELERDTRELICSFYRIYTGLSRPERNRHKALGTMKRVVDDVLTKHSITFKGMVNRLDLEHRDDMSFVQDVAEKTFGDGTTNWGRITSLVAFGAVLSEHLKRGGRPECVETVAEQISSYLANNKYDWLRDNNGWNGFIEFFHVEDPEALVRNTLMAVVGFAGLGAGLALLTR